jgi:hypothetical protein
VTGPLAYLNICSVLANVIAVVLVLRKDQVSRFGWVSLANFVCVLADVVSHAWLMVPFNAGAGVMAFIIWWRRRRDKRRRAAALIGAKSRALRDSLVRRMAEEAV